MRDTKIDFTAQAGAGIKQICDAIEGLKMLKKQYKEQLRLIASMELDISHELGIIKSNLKDMMQLIEEEER